MEFCPFTVEPRFNKPYITNSLLQRTIFFNLAKVTVRCMEQNLDLRKSLL